MATMSQKPEVVRSQMSPVCFTDSGVGGSDGDDEQEARRQSSGAQCDFDEYVLNAVGDCQKPLESLPSIEDAAAWIHEKPAGCYKNSKKNKCVGLRGRHKRTKKPKPAIGSFTNSKERDSVRQKNIANGDLIQRDLSWMPIKYCSGSYPQEGTSFTEKGVQTDRGDTRGETGASAESMASEFQRGPFWNTMALVQSLSMERFSWNSWIKFIEQSSGLGESDSFGLYKWSTRRPPPGLRGEYHRMTARERFLGRELQVQGTKFPDIDPDQFQLTDYVSPARPRRQDRWGCSADLGKTPGELSILMGKARNRRKAGLSVGPDSYEPTTDKSETNSANPRLSVNLGKTPPKQKDRKSVPRHGMVKVKIDKNRCHLSVHLPVLGEPTESLPSCPLLISSSRDPSRGDESSRRPAQRPSNGIHTQGPTRLAPEWQRREKTTEEPVDFPISVVKLPRIAPAAAAAVGPKSDSCKGSGGEDDDDWMAKLNQYRRQAMCRSPEVPPGTPASLASPPPRCDSSGKSGHIESVLPPSPRPGSLPSSPRSTPSVKRRPAVSPSVVVRLPNIGKTRRSTREPVKMPSVPSITSSPPPPVDDCREDTDS